jgi:hypothetical protein
MPRPARQDLRVNYSGTLDVLVRFRADAVKMDLTGWTAKLQITSSGLHFTRYASVGGSGVTVTDPTLGEVELYLNNSDVQNLSLPADYEVILTSPGGDPNPYLAGRILEAAE